MVYAGRVCSPNASPSLERAKKTPQGRTQNRWAANSSDGARASACRLGTHAEPVHPISARSSRTFRGLGPGGVKASSQHGPEGRTIELAGSGVKGLRFARRLTVPAKEGCFPE